MTQILKEIFIGAVLTASLGVLGCICLLCVYGGLELLRLIFT